LVQITHYTSPNYTDHPQVNMHWIHCIENIFTVQDFWATCTCHEKQSCLKNFTALNIFFIIQDFWATLRSPWKTEFALNILTALQGRNQLFISGGRQFSWNFTRWRYHAYSTVVQLFRKRSHISFSSQHFRKWEFFSFNQDADRIIRTE